MPIRITFLDKTVRVSVEVNGTIESAITELPRRPWVGLTEKEISEISRIKGTNTVYDLLFARAIEGKLKEKNT